LVKAIRDGDGPEAERIARQRVADSRDAAIKLLQETKGIDTGDRENHRTP
jgi:hypothetical protein